MDRGVRLATLAAALALSGALLASATPPPPPTYEKDILPLFAQRCLPCHGAGKPAAGLDLRTLGSVLQGAASGKVVLPATPEKSPLYTVLRSGQMPPSGAKLRPEETARVLRWLQSGARGDARQGGHWAFRPPVRPVVPSVPGASNPIDAFLKTAMQKPTVARATLLRRVTFDLIGLPPTPEETAAFAADTKPGAYERVVDRLLADLRYGERQARFWLDLAGYADSEGVLQEDRIRPNAWRYRDYVIQSFNADKPYDRFLQEQLAGDELSGYRTATRWTPEIEAQVVATGFLRTAVDATRDDFNEHQFTEYQYRMLHDTETILVSTTMALTIQCARCHDHKYEPLSQKDYYRIQAALMGAIRPKGKLLPTYARRVIAATYADQNHADDINAQVEAALKSIGERESALLGRYRGSNGLAPNADAATVRKAVPAIGQELDALAAERAAANQRRITFPELRALYDQDASPPPTPLLHRGEYEKPKEAVAPGVPTILDDPNNPFVVPTPEPGARTTGRRTALARWLTRPNHPLTARVAVNRLWAQHFGVGIVPTTENFGRSGQPPSNPALLDWLATELVREGWSLKKLHRLMVTSHAYQQPHPSRRLDAEALRDSVLAVAGTLDPKLYGEPVALEVRGTGEIAAAGEAAGGRRSIYLQVRRTQPISFLNAFDAPVMETNCTRRAVSATPTQALALLNSSFLASQSEHFARRLAHECPVTTTPWAALNAQVERAFSLALSRSPSESERRQGVGFIQSQTSRYLRLGKRPDDAAIQARADFCLALLSSNAFLYTD